MSRAGAGAASAIKEIDRLSDLEPYRAAWHDLLAQAETNTIYQTYEWITAWWRCFGRDRRLLVLLLFDKSGLTGIAPLQLAKKRVNGWPERVLGFIGAENCAADYCDFIVPRGRVDLLEALLQRLWLGGGFWSTGDFSAFPTHSAHFAAVEECFRRAGLAVVRAEEREAPTVVLGDRDADGRLVNKKSLKRHFNHFRSSGALSFEQYGGAAEIIGRLPAFFEQHIRRWAGTGSPSLFLHPDQREFYRRLVEELCPRGWLKMAEVRHDGRLIAGHVGFEYGGRFIWYKPSFDIALAKHSPGEVLLKCLLEYAIARHLNEFDFTVGGEQFKHRFANLVRKNGRLLVFRRRISLALMRSRMMLGELKRGIKLRLRSSNKG